MLVIKAGCYRLKEIVVSNHKLKTTDIKILKRSAKNLKKKQNINHHEALDIIAQENGFNAWSHLMNTSYKTNPESNDEQEKYLKESLVANIAEIEKELKNELEELVTDKKTENFKEYLRENCEPPPEYFEEEYYHDTWVRFCQDINLSSDSFGKAIEEKQIKFNNKVFSLNYNEFKKDIGFFQNNSGSIGTFILTTRILYEKDYDKHKGNSKWLEESNPILKNRTPLDIISSKETYALAINHIKNCEEESLISEIEYYVENIDLVSDDKKTIFESLSKALMNRSQAEQFITEINLEKNGKQLDDQLNKNGFH